MERKLRNILDYQRFSSNPRLSAMISDVEKRYAGAARHELSDDELSFVNAAGNANPAKEDKDDPLNTHR